MDPRAREKQADQLTLQGPPAPEGSPLTVLGFSSPGTEKEQGQNCSGAPLRPDPTVLSPPSHGPPSGDTVHGGLRDCQP